MEGVVRKQGVTKGMASEMPSYLPGSIQSLGQPDGSRVNVDAGAIASSDTGPSTTSETIPQVTRSTSPVNQPRSKILPIQRQPVKIVAPATEIMSISEEGKERLRRWLKGVPKAKSGRHSRRSATSSPVRKATSNPSVFRPASSHLNSSRQDFTLKPSPFSQRSRTS